LVALCDRRDAKHPTAVRDLASMRAEEFAICDAVLAETCFYLPHQSQRRRLRLMLDELNVQAVPASNGPEFWLQAFDWLDKYAEHEPDWADACLAILSGHNRGFRIWTYDREFRTTWRRPNGSAIPLAVKAT
jgi:predicted nucleic acid-binding protein